MSPIETVQKMYAAFGKGEVPAILACLADDVEWEYGPNSTRVPWLQPRRGPAQVAAFFQADLEIRKFEPKTFLASGNVVVVLIDLEATVRSTGRPIVEADEAHIWYFDGAGKVSRFRHRIDTQQQAEAWQQPAAV